MTIVTGESLIPAKIYLDKIIGFAASLLPAPHLLNILLCVSGLKRPDLFTLKLVGSKLRASNLIFNNCIYICNNISWSILQLRPIQSQSAKDN